MVLTKMKETAEQYLNKKVKYVFCHGIYVSRTLILLAQSCCGHCSGLLQ